MNNDNFRELIDSLPDLTAVQKRYLLNQTKMSLDDEALMLVTNDLLTREELDALLAPVESPK